MTTDRESHRYPLWLRKLVIPALIGALAGFAATFAMMRYIDSSAADGLGASAAGAAVVGVLYCVMAAIIMVGTASPRLGARLLNVEDADELREQRRVLALSGGAMALWGAALLALALAAPEGPVPQTLALAIGVGGLVIGSGLSVLVYRASDELMLAVNLEAGALTYGLVLLMVGMWAALAHLDYVAGPEPLDLLSLFYVLMLVASFIATGRRGMLTIK
jgi:hypothetical protein